MYLSTTLPLLVLATATSASVLDVRQSPNNNTITEEYLRKVCNPEVTSGPTPPCQSILNIASACQPNGTTPLALQAHAQCMCGGSFFSDWEGCLACNAAHGARSPQVAQVFLSIISTASNRLCTGTPTADFAAIFTGLSDSSGAQEAGGVASDRFPDQTAVSLYYTLVTSQGPGAITGSATGATNTRNVLPTEVVSSVSRVVTSGSARTTGTVATTSSRSVAAASGSSTSTSASGARETGAWMGALGVVAGGAALAIL